MSKFRIKLTDPFKRDLKHLAKKHVSIINDVENLFNELYELDNKQIRKTISDSLKDLKSNISMNI